METGKGVGRCTGKEQKWRVSEVENEKERVRKVSRTAVNEG